MTDVTALDGAALRSLLEMTGDDAEFVGELVDTYLADAPGQLAAMRDAVREGSAKALVRPAHTLKGNSANVGATRLADLCRELEALGREGSLAGAAELVAAAEAEFARVIDALSAARSLAWVVP